MCITQCPNISAAYTNPHEGIPLLITDRQDHWLYAWLISPEIKWYWHPRISSPDNPSRNNPFDPPKAVVSLFCRLHTITDFARSRMIGAVWVQYKPKRVYCVSCTVMRVTFIDLLLDLLLDILRPGIIRDWPFSLFIVRICMGNAITMCFPIFKTVCPSTRCR